MRKALLLVVAIASCGGDDGVNPPNSDMPMPDLGDDVSVDMSGDASCEPDVENFGPFFRGCEEVEEVLTQTIAVWNIDLEPVLVLAIGTWSKPLPDEFEAVVSEDLPLEIPPCEAFDLTVTWTPTPESMETVTIGGVALTVREGGQEVQYEGSLCAVNGRCPWEEPICAL